MRVSHIDVTAARHHPHVSPFIKDRQVSDLMLAHKFGSSSATILDVT
jgi:hypothetical protein